MAQGRSLRSYFAGVLRSIAPLAVVVLVFQWLLVGGPPQHLERILAGVGAFLVGVTLILRALDTAIFPVGRSLSDALIARGSLPWLLTFGFALGFSAVIAEPSLIALAHKAALVSGGRIDAPVLRLVIAASVGLMVAVGLLRSALDHPIHWYLVPGYLLLVPITWLTPPEITGLAFDAGAVSVNLITVPLLLALGLGLARALRRRNPLLDGLGLLGLAVLAPRVTVQLYGIAVCGGELASTCAGVEATTVWQTPAASDRGWAELGTALLRDLSGILQSALPMLLVVLVFQYGVIRRPLPHRASVAGGLVLLVIGLMLFVEGLRIGLFPLGYAMAGTLGGLDSLMYLYTFVFLIGFTTTLVEPALAAAISRLAVERRSGLNTRAVHLCVAAGVGAGLALGVYRMVSGIPLEHLFAGLIGALVLATWLAPRFIRALAYDLGGVATSDVTVPVITALGVALAAALGSGNVLLDGFGLVALASLCPILVVLAYALVTSGRSSPGDP